MGKVLKNFLSETSYGGVAGAKKIKLVPGEQLKVVMTSGFGYIEGGELYKVKRAKGAKARLVKIGEMSIEEVREYNKWKKKEK